MRSGLALEVGEILACANQKGGVGKTTTVVNLAAYLASSGRRVLVVDLDPQGNATSGLGLDRGAQRDSSYNVLVQGETAVSNAIPTAVAGLSVVPSTADLAGAEIELVAMDERERHLARALEGSGDEFDCILIDCPPSFGLLTINALTAADSVLIPIQCEYYALEGLSQLMTTIDLVRTNLNPRLRLRGVVMTMYDARTALASDVIAEVRRHLDGRVFETIVPRSVRLAEAPSYGQPVSLYSPESKGALAYRALAEELLSGGPRASAAEREAQAWALSA